jgi:adenine C2-methylase RlmN of 23S rRNA A2503 and tRNA A37
MQSKVSSNSAKNVFKMKAKSKEFKNILVKFESKIKEKNTLSAKTKATLERSNVNRKFHRVKRQSNKDLSKKYFFITRNKYMSHVPVRRIKRDK